MNIFKIKILKYMIKINIKIKINFLLVLTQLTNITKNNLIKDIS